MWNPFNKSTTEGATNKKGKLKGCLLVLAVLLVIGMVSNAVKSCRMAIDPEYAAQVAQEQAEKEAREAQEQADREAREADRKAPDTFIFSDLDISAARDGESYDIIVTVTGTISNEMTRSVNTLRIPKLLFNLQENWVETDGFTIESGESTPFSYEVKCQGLDEEYEWSFTTPENSKTIGLEGVIEDITEKYEAVRSEVAYIKAADEERAAAEAAAKAAEEAQRKAEEEQRKAEEEAAKAAEQAQRDADRAAEQEAARQRHLDATCWVTPTGTKYHESPGCPKLNGSTNLIEMTVGNAKNQGYEPCSNCAS